MNQNRRQFFKSVARGGILGLLALGSGVMAKRWMEADACRRDYRCSACGLSDRCALPEAGNYRHEQKVLNKTPDRHGSGK